MPINLDVAPINSVVRSYDARRPLPFEEDSVDVVYHSHRLEHLNRNDAERFLTDCFRILKAGGTMRVIVPDLEGIARAYIHSLEEVRRGEDETLYEWTRMELVDQLAREKSGGEMAEFLQGMDTKSAELVRIRAGGEIDGHLGVAGEHRAPRRVTLRKIAGRLQLLIAQMAVGMVGGRRMVSALKTGVFRQRGEVHRMMYDDFSLAHLLTSVGFVRVARMSANASSIPQFHRYGLDVQDGEVRKPDSLFMEAQKP